jgi:RNase P subunit RPR2
LRGKSGGRAVRAPPKTGKDPTKEIKRDVKESSEVRYVTDGRGGEKIEFQVAWHVNRTMKHIHCKNCDSKWYFADKGDNIKHHFLMTGDNIRCLKCGTEVNISVV